MFIGGNMNIDDFLKMVKKDLSKHYKIKELYRLDSFTKHFGIGMYIRNKYLWHDEELVNELNKHFHTTNVDSLSNEIVNAIMKSIKIKKEDLLKINTDS